MVSLESRETQNRYFYIKGFESKRTTRIVENQNSCSGIFTVTENLNIFGVFQILFTKLSKNKSHENIYLKGRSV